MRLSPSLLTLATQLSLRVAAQDIYDSMFEDFTLQDFNEAVRDPDAAGEADLPREVGKDLTTEWPGEDIGGWKIRIDIKADVPASDAGYTTLTRVSYVPPSSIKVKSNATSKWAPMDPTWYPCSNYWISELTSSSDKVKGDCSGVLSDACVSDLNEVMTDGFFGDYESEFPGPKCPLTSVPDSCRDAFGEGEWRGIVPGRDSPTDLFDLNRMFYFEEYDLHGKGDSSSAYQTALDRVWVVGTGWGYSKYSEYANGTSSLAINGSISCLKATEAFAALSGEEDVQKDDPDTSGDDDEEAPEDEDEDESVASNISRDLYMCFAIGLFISLLGSS